MVARLIAETDINDVSPGSLALTLLEAAGSSDFSQEGKLLQLLNLRSVDTASGTDLENLAFEMGLNPTKIGATPSQVLLTISESAFSKVASNIYAGSVSPAAGDTTFNIVNGTGFKASGTIHIGRGTSTEETISYVSISNTGSYWILTLSSPLTKDHLVGEEVVLSQGGDRIIPVNTVAFVQGVAGVSNIQFTTQAQYTMLDGEDKLSNVSAIAVVPGSSGNVTINKITSFQGAPWSTATVSNPTPAVGGLDPETDTQLRQRIKDQVHSLSGGTQRAIIRAVIGAYDDIENKRVVSAYVKEPTSNTDNALLYIDDGTGFKPSFSGVGEEVIVTNASGTESIFQLQQWPLVKSEVASISTEPFALNGGESLYVIVDGQHEEVVIPSTAYRNPGSVLAQEVAEAINGPNGFKTIEARAKDGQLFIAPVSNDPDYIQVGTATLAKDSNGYLNFPTTKKYTIKLYKNNVLLEKNGLSAVIQSLANSQWTGLTSTETLQLNVDGINTSIMTFHDIDFATYTSSSTIASATVTDWATMINQTFIGVTAQALDDGTFSVASNRGASSKASISVIGGSLSTKLFPINSSSTGIASQFTLNPYSGQLQLSTPLSAGDTLTAGTTNTRGFVQSSVASTFNLSASNGNAANLVLIADSTYSSVAVAQSGTISTSSPSSGLMRLSGVSGQFNNVNSDDWVHLFNFPVSGLFKVFDRASDGSYVDLFAYPSSFGSAILDGINTKMTFFRTSGLPQLVTLPIGNSVSASAIVNSINSQIIEATASIVDSGAIQLQTLRYSSKGSLSIPSIGGTTSNLGISAGIYSSNEPHVAAIESGNLLGTPHKRILVNVPSLVAPYTDLNAQNNPFEMSDINKEFMSYSSSDAKYVRQVALFNSSSDITLTSDLPTPPVGLGSDTKGTLLAGVELGQQDNMVFLVDNDPAQKTFDIPMYIDGTIAGTVTPTSSQFDVLDLTGSAFGTSNRWSGYSLNNYRAWFQANNVLPSSPANSKIKFTSAKFGPNGENIYAGVIYPSTPNQAVGANFSIDALNNKIVVSANLASGNESLFGLQPNKRVQISANTNQKILTFMPPVDLSNVQVGSLVSVNDLTFNLANQGTSIITAINNFSDNAVGFQFVSEGATVNITSSTQVHLTTSTKPIVPGDTITISGVTLAVQSVTDATDVVVANPGFTAGAGIAATLNHSYITAASVPNFSVSTGDLIQVGSNIMSVTGLLDSQNFNVSIPFSFTGLLTGTVSRLQLITKEYGTVISETQNVAAAASIRIFPIVAASNTASKIIAAINGTAGVDSIVTASNATGNDGSGILVQSTEDDLANGNQYVQLLNGESFVYQTNTSSPAIQLKKNLSQVPNIGDKVRFVPSTPTNIANHFSKKQISGLTIAADVQLVDENRRVQVASLTPGGVGQVFAVGGTASGNNLLAIRNNAQQVNSGIAQIEMDAASIDMFVPGHTVKIKQSGRAKKNLPTVSGADTLSISIPTTGSATISISQPFVNIYNYTQSGTNTWLVRQLIPGRVRFELFSGNAVIPSLLQVDDWVLVGTGESYTGITTDTAFAPANRGWYQVRETDNATYFDVDGTCFEQYVNTSTNSFVFTSYHSARVGDQIVLGLNMPVSTSNKGTFTISAINSANSITYANSNAVVQSTLSFGTGTSAFSILDQGYTTYRKVTLVAPKPSDPTNRSIAVVSPGFNMSLISEGQGAYVSLPNRLYYPTNPVPGVNGYDFWTGLLQRVQRILNGYAPDPADFPGVAAAGIQIIPRPPQITNVALALKIYTAQGVSLQAISDSIKSNVYSYVNSLGLGQNVVLSEVVSIVQSVPGVSSCYLISPTLQSNLIVVGNSAIARIAISDITLS